MGYVSVEKDGKEYEAEYTVDGNVVTVYGDGGSESTQIGGMKEEGVARILLNNLVRKGHIDPQ